MGSGLFTASATTAPSEKLAELEKPNKDLYESFIEDLLGSHKVVVFSKTNCGYCTRAKNLMKDLDLKYHSIELDINQQCPQENCNKLASTLVLQTRMRTVPQIFINGKLVGGYTEFERLSKTESFQEMLK